MQLKLLLKLMPSAVASLITKKGCRLLLLGYAACYKQNPAQAHSGCHQVKLSLATSTLLLKWCPL